MAENHPYPQPVILAQEVIDEIVPEACLDADHETLWEDDPAAFLRAFDKISVYADYIRALLAGELTEAWIVLRAQKQLRKRLDWVAEEIGHEVLRRDRARWNVRRRLSATKAIREARHQARVLKAAHQETGRWWNEYMEYDKDTEAAERLGLAWKEVSG